MYSANPGGAHIFSHIPGAELERSAFDRSSGLKTAFDSGFLVPIFVDEALPGDTFNLRCNSFCRMSTPLYPVMDNMFMDFFFFAVPCRLLWSKWQNFMGEEVTPGDTTEYLLPKMAAINAQANSLYDYMGIPTGVNCTPNALPFRAYNLIWNEWFRDQNLQNRVSVLTGDGPDAGSTYALLRRGKRHDYFTGCLPWPQKGAAVEIPVGVGIIPVVPSSTVPGAIPTFKINPLGTPVLNEQIGTASGRQVSWRTSPGGDFPAGWQDPALEVDLSIAQASTINQIREAFQVQRLLERDARGGTRYTEILRSHFGVVSPDARLQRPEYLGGGSARINVNPVASTAEASTTPTRLLGSLAAFGTSAAQGVGFVKSFTEHCYILGLVSVRADLTYQQGLERMWSRSTRFDFYWPALSHLGEQPVLNKEIYLGGDASDDLTFGYQERYAEYRYKPSRTCSFMRSAHAQSLDAWHLALDFAARPALNAAFIEDNPPIARVVAVDTEPEFIGDFWFNLKCARPMPTYSVPGLIDHF